MVCLCGMNCVASNHVECIYCVGHMNALFKCIVMCWLYITHIFGDSVWFIVRCARDFLPMWCDIAHKELFSLTIWQTNHQQIRPKSQKSANARYFAVFFFFKKEINRNNTILGQHLDRSRSSIDASSKASRAFSSPGDHGSNSENQRPGSRKMLRSNQEQTRPDSVIFSCFSK